VSVQKTVLECLKSLKLSKFQIIKYWLITLYNGAHLRRVMSPLFYAVGASVRSVNKTFAAAKVQKIFDICKSPMHFLGNTGENMTNLQEVDNLAQDVDKKAENRLKIEDMQRWHANWTYIVETQGTPPTTH